MKKQPNILFIMCDDHASQAISAYGSRVCRTPNIDRIAEAGMRFDHCYVTNSICTPSRATILTGTHNHVNGVTTLTTHLDNRLPNVAKHLRQGGYQTAIVGKWHLGQGERHWPTGFDYWSILPGQGVYHDPEFCEMGESRTESGYVTDITTDKCLDWLRNRDKQKPFFLMCHHKAPHRPWDPKPEHRNLYSEPIEQPETFDDDYSNRATPASIAKMRITEDFTYDDLDLVQLPEASGALSGIYDQRLIPHPDGEELVSFRLRCQITGEEFSFESEEELKNFKYQRYMRKYLQCVHSIDENVGRLLDYLEQKGLADDTVVVYTSDQGFYLGEHGWFDKRFIYEESFQMPLLISYPGTTEAGSSSEAMVSNVDFAQTFLDIAGLRQPNYMQGRSFLPILNGQVPQDWTDLAYHRYWMNRDTPHNAIAHYGIRTHDYKLIYWYDEDCGEDGANPGDGIHEWELFDLRKDPKELMNVYEDPNYVETVREMTKKLEDEMERIGDTPMHSRIEAAV